MKKVSIENAEHYSWGAGCDGWHLVNQPSLSVIRERMPAGAAETNHRHHRARQFFHVLSGAATMHVEGADFVLHAGEGVEIPPGVPHRIRNDSSTDAEFLVVSQPHSHGDREVV
jgi:mannose-6-phosphate isomerase-like protein (cupin superfamily)